MNRRNGGSVAKSERSFRPWFPAHREARDTATARSAAKMVRLIEQQQDVLAMLGERELFAALHACAYRAFRAQRRRHASAKKMWLSRRGTIRAHIVEGNRGLVYLAVSRFRSYELDHEELGGEGLLALVRAVDWFDPWRGVRFSTYAYNAIARAMVRLSRKVNRQRRLVPYTFDNPIEEPTRQDPWGDLYADRLNYVLENNLGDLTDREFHILGKRFPSDSDRRLTLEEVGVECGLSKERVRQIQNRALSKLRTVLESDPVLQ